MTQITKYMSKKTIRVFPRRTNATPDDQDVRIATTPALWDEADEIHISVAFTWDIPWAEWAAIQWKHVAPVQLGGPAFNEPGSDFVPGMYMKKGYVLRCYVLIGYKGDTIEKAEARMKQTFEAGFMPMAMLFRDKKGDYSQNWKQFQRQWANPIITACNCKKLIQ